MQRQEGDPSHSKQESCLTALLKKALCRVEGVALAHLMLKSIRVTNKVWYARTFATTLPFSAQFYTMIEPFCYLADSYRARILLMLSAHIYPASISGKVGNMRQSASNSHSSLAASLVLAGVAILLTSSTDSRSCPSFLLWYCHQPAKMQWHALTLLV